MKITKEQIKKAVEILKIDIDTDRKILKTMVDPSEMDVSSSLRRHRPEMSNDITQIIIVMFGELNVEDKEIIRQSIQKGQAETTKDD